MSIEISIILFWWLMFGSSHMLGSSIPVRTFIIERIGRMPFRGLYSLVAFATFIPLCSYFAAHKHAGEMFYEVGPALQAACYILMLSALLVLIQGLISNNPLSIQSELSGQRRRQARGIERICRHPQNLSFALFGGAHMLSNPYPGDWIFFGGFVCYALLSAIHQDRRTRTLGPEELRQFQAETSLIPFAAMVKGKQKIIWREFNRFGLLAALALFAGLIGFHPSLFGGLG